jgi:hypothetical protein
MEYTLAENIVDIILSDLESRSGVGNALEEIDDDVYHDMKESLIYLIEDRLKGVML